MSNLNTNEDFNPTKIIDKELDKQLETGKASEELKEKINRKNE